MPDAPVLLGWSAVSPFGIGRQAFEHGVRTVRTGPPDGAPYVPDFDIRAVLGPKRTRSMDRVSALAVTTTRELLAETGAAVDPADTAVVLATSGTLQQMRDFTRASLLAAKPFYVDPAVIPNGVMNCAAAQTAIWHRLQGPNATIASGRTAGLVALTYACRLLAAGRARHAVVGAAEEYSPTRAWLDLNQCAPEPVLALGEGCVMCLVEAGGGPGAPAAVDILGVEHRVYQDPAKTMRQCLEDALNRHSVRPGDIWAVATSSTAGQERAAVADVFGEDVLNRVPDLVPIGETASATAMFQLAALLATHPPRGRSALITTVDPGGTLACALFRFRS